ncbi:MAG: hypothetical protein DLM56_08670 [Pseudonocardiales bacterium]|nr:MAG: hypothetical protein DLM56_08670 [Pseudonocardiales bacterium]
MTTAPRPSPAQIDVARDGVAFLEAVLQQDLDAKAAIIAGCDLPAVVNVIACMLVAVAWAADVDLTALCADWRSTVAAAEAESL